MLFRSGDISNDYVPANVSLPDCDTTNAFAVPPSTVTISTSRTENERLLTLSGIIDGLPLPATLTQSPFAPSVYVGEVVTETRRTFHEITLVGNQQLQWRVMVSDLLQNCRLGTIEAIGRPLGQ